MHDRHPRTRDSSSRLSIPNSTQNTSRSATGPSTTHGEDVERVREIRDEVATRAGGLFDEFADESG